MMMRKLEDMIKAGLNLLQKEKYITFEKVYMIHYQDEYTKDIVIEECTPKQQEIIESVKEEILTSEGYKSEQEIHLKSPSIIRIFYEKMNNRLEERYQFRCYRAYQIDSLQNKPYFEFNPVIQEELIVFLQEMILDAIENEKEKLERKINTYTDQLDDNDTTSIAAQMVLAQKTLTKWINENFKEMIDIYVC